MHNVVKMIVIAGGAAFLVDRFGGMLGLDKIANPTAAMVARYSAIGLASGLTAKLAKAI